MPNENELVPLIPEYKPTCHSSGSVAGKRGVLKKNEVLGNTISKLAAGKTLFKAKTISIKYDSVKRWVPVRRYNRFWLKSANNGVMMHPMTRATVWFNKEALITCNLMNGDNDIDQMLRFICNGIRDKEELSQRAHRLVSFLILLEDLDMVRITRQST